jgi:hypothetical protein
MNTLIVKLMGEVSELSKSLGTDPNNLISLMKERIDYGRALESVLLGKPVPVREVEDDDRITKSDIDWCIDKLKFLLQPENRNEYVRILDQRD